MVTIVERSCQLDRSTNKEVSVADCGDKEGLQDIISWLERACR